MKSLMSVLKTVALVISAVVALFAVFPLTDTDIWWHLACAREWVTTWTPVREPVVNVHEYFQQVVAFVYNLGGARLLVAFKAILWGIVFALFIWPPLRAMLPLAFFITILFIFRYQFEIRPVLFSLIFLGIYWNILPWLLAGVGGARNSRLKCHSSLRTGIAFRVFAAFAILVLQFLWCKFQGLYILGPVFALTVLAFECLNTRNYGVQISRKSLLWQFAFVALLFAMPFFHREGLNLFLYPFGLLDRLLGLSPSAAVFASEIAENRSPITLLMAGENVLQSALMIVLCFVGIIWAVYCLCLFFSISSSRPVILANAKLYDFPVDCTRALWLLVTACLAFVAERNFVLFLPVFFAVAFKCLYSLLRSAWPRMTAYSQLPTVCFLLPTLLIAFLLGLWLRSVSNYDSMIAYQRVPVAAAEWMKSHPHSGRLFNDDRAGGYLAFVNPSDSTYIDGRFILKTAKFFENYLRYAESPQVFLHDAGAQNIDRVVLPLRYYARWGKLLAALDSAENWHVAYRDSLFVVIDRTQY